MSVELFDTFEIDDKKYEDLKMTANILKDKFRKMLVDYKKALFMNKDYSFVFRDISVENIFGKFIDYRMVKVS